MLDIIIMRFLQTIQLWMAAWFKIIMEIFANWFCCGLLYLEGQAFAVAVMLHSGAKLDLQ